MSRLAGRLGLGVAWRVPLAGLAASLSEPGASPGLGFVEVIAEATDAAAPPRHLDALRERDVRVIPHGLTLSLGGAELPEPGRLDHLARLATRLGSPLVSEHIAFVRAGGVDTGHLLPVPRTHAALDVLVANVEAAQAALPVPLALEHVAALFEWPDAEMDEAEFLCALLDRTGALLLLDVAYLYANARNHGFDALAWLDRAPLDRLAYVHVGGGTVVDGVYHDTHRHPVLRGVLDLVEELCARAAPPGVLLERDDDFPPAAVLAAELEAIRAAVERGAARRSQAGAAGAPTGGR